MPELPETETIARDLDRAITGRRITQVVVLRPDVLREGAADELVARTIGRAFTRAWRRAKLIVLELDSGDRIVVQPSDAEETTASGLVIPDTAKEKPQQGEVLAVGPGRRSEQTGEIIPLDVKVGDKVVYSKYGGTEITVDGKDVLILNGRDVLAILK